MVKLGDEDFGRERFDDDEGLDDAGQGFCDRGANGGDQPQRLVRGDASTIAQ